MLNLSKTEKRYLTSDKFRKTPHGRKVKHQIKVKVSKAFDLIIEVWAFDKINNLFSIENKLDDLYKYSDDERRDVAQWLADGIINKFINIEDGKFIKLNDYPSLKNE